MIVNLNFVHKLISRQQGLLPKSKT